VIVVYHGQRASCHASAIKRPVAGAVLLILWHSRPIELTALRRGLLGLMVYVWKKS